MAVSPYPETVPADMEDACFQEERTEWPDTLYMNRFMRHGVHCGLIMPRGNRDWAKVRVFAREDLRGCG